MVAEIVKLPLPEPLEGDTVNHDAALPDTDHDEFDVTDTLTLDAAESVDQFVGLTVRLVAAVTVNVTVKLLDVTLLPLTVTVAVCVPAVRPVRGTTVKLAFPFADILGTDVLLRVKLDAFVPERAIVSTPVA